VMAGMGITFISAHTIGLELATGRLCVLDVRGLPVLRQWFAVHLAGRRLSPVTARFREFLLAAGADAIERSLQDKMPARATRRRRRVSAR